MSCKTHAQYGAIFNDKGLFHVYTAGLLAFLYLNLPGLEIIMTKVTKT
jgi:hypothetical protein